MVNLFSQQPASIQQAPLLSKGQMGIKGAVGNQALKTLQGLGSNQFDFAPIAQQARTQFQTQTIPGLAERFTSLGSGAQRSSAFQGALGQAGSDLEQGLAALQSQYGLHQQGLQQQLLNMLLSSSLSPEFENVVTEGGPGILSELGPTLGKLLPYLAPLLGGLFGGPVGAAAGSALGGLSSLGQSSSLSPNYSNMISNILGGR